MNVAVMKNENAHLHKFLLSRWMAIRLMIPYTEKSKNVSQMESDATIDQTKSSAHDEWGVSEDWGDESGDWKTVDIDSKSVPDDLKMNPALSDVIDEDLVKQFASFGFTKPTDGCNEDLYDEFYVSVCEESRDTTHELDRRSRRLMEKYEQEEEFMESTSCR